MCCSMDELWKHGCLKEARERPHKEHRLALPGMEEVDPGAWLLVGIELLRLH